MDEDIVYTLVKAKENLLKEILSEIDYTIKRNL